jgi:integrase
MGLANKSVILYESIKIGTKWKLRPVDEDSSHFSNGPFYVSWYEGKKKQMEPVGRDPEHALRMANLKRAALAYVSAGGEVKNIPPVKNQVQGSKGSEPENASQTQIRAGASKESEAKNENTSEISLPDGKTIRIAISEYLEDCLDRQGKSGYGLASRTYEAYEYRLGFLAQFKPKALLGEIDDQFLKAFRRFLREHPDGLSDRTAYNIVQAVSTFLLRNGISAAKRVLKEMSFPPTIVIPYSGEQMRTFFAACDAKDELLFKFFLHSMAREMEVAHCEVRDLKFESNVLHICPKPDRNFRLKGKRSGQAKKGRKVPLPTLFMARMQEYCADKGPRDLLFPNALGTIQFHFLRKCKVIAERARIKSWKDFNLHRWRKTGATKHHEEGVSVRKIQAWLGHESLEVTLDYLGVEDAADDMSQQQVNNGALAEFV